MEVEGRSKAAPSAEDVQLGDSDVTDADGALTVENSRQEVVAA